MNKIRKVLIVRFSSIGDIVLTTPVIRCIKTQLHVEVHYLTKQSFAGILSSNPYVDQVYAFKKEINEVIPALKQERYDLVIDLHNNLRSRMIRWKLGRKTTSFNKINVQKWLMVNLKVNWLPNVHIVDRYMDTLSFLGVKNDNKGLDYFIPESDHIQIETITGPDPKPFIAFVIGAAHKTKCLPKEKIAAICQQVDAPIILLGGPDETSIGQWIAQHAGPHVYNTCGQLKLNQSASIVQQAQKVITHDTGLMHIAAAFKKDIISIWGNTIPAFGMYPYNPEDRFKSILIEHTTLSCRPCSKIGYNKCPKGHFKCMMEIKKEEVIDAL